MEHGPTLEAIAWGSGGRGKPPRSHVDFERRASSGLSYDGGCSGGLLWHRVFALAQSLPFPWQHFMEA
jgi:hypothetical protein